MSEQHTVSTALWWKNKKVIIRIVVAAVLVVVVLIAFIAAAYIFHLPGTGLSSSHKTTTTTEVTQPSNAQKVTTTVEDQPAKTLWDWLPLLIQLLGALAIPIVVAIGTAIFTTRQTQISEANRKQQHDTEMQIAEKQQQEELLRTYFDKLSDLLLDKELNTNSKIQSIIRARTLAVLHILNTERKAIVLRFLHDSNLLQYVKSFLYSLDLSHADLNGIDLSQANLSDANLSEANLSNADLSQANLSRATLYRTNFRTSHLRQANLNLANLSQANLSQANLEEADLDGARLRQANLVGANLSQANLSGAYLEEADLNLANLSQANLSQANLEEATITPKQLEEAKNVISEQLAQIRKRGVSRGVLVAARRQAALQEATTVHPFTTPSQSETQPD